MIKNIEVIDRIVEHINSLNFEELLSIQENLAIEMAIMSSHELHNMEILQRYTVEYELLTDRINQYK